MASSGTAYFWGDVVIVVDVHLSVEDLVETGQPPFTASVLKKRPVQGIFQSCDTGVLAIGVCNISRPCVLNLFKIFDVLRSVRVPGGGGIVNMWTDKSIKKSFFDGG